MHRTFFRTFTTTAMMVLVSFLLIGAAFGFASRQVFVSEARESMMTNSREISRMAVAYAAEGDLRSLELRMTLSTIGASTGQHIFVINPSGYIITCSDSRVIPESIFSAGIGDLFVIRIAGNVIDDHQLGSIEYA